MTRRASDPPHATPEGFDEVALGEGGRPPLGRYYGEPGAEAAVVWVGGVGGGWDSPARALYPRLADAFQARGVASLRVRYRHPTDVPECVRDVLAGVAFLESHGIRRIAFVGHSLGGAVVLQAAAAAPRLARAVVTLASQSHGADAVADLAPGVAVLSVHGRKDHILPARCSESIQHAAAEPKRLVLLDGAGHVLDEAREAVEREVVAWLRTHLPA